MKGDGEEEEGEVHSQTDQKKRGETMLACRSLRGLTKAQTSALGGQLARM